MIGLLATPLKIQMGSLMNGYINNAEVFLGSFLNLQFSGRGAIIGQISGSGQRVKASIPLAIISAIRTERSETTIKMAVLLNGCSPCDRRRMEATQPDHPLDRE